VAIGNQDPAYHAKMMHRIPEAEVEDRIGFLERRCKDKVVAHFGSASGTLHNMLGKYAKRVIGYDIQPGPNTDHVIDCDDAESLRESPPDYNVDVVVIPELIEHLGNPLQFLKYIHKWYPKQEIIITTPNALCLSNDGWARKGFENVNIDHTCWFSPHTLETLLDRARFTIKEFYWYNGISWKSEGMIVVVEGY
jgi:2-polyprenyl-3-methyl-5-hydroxy-6-metoxy-1,4-benzoquinol methylase